MTADQFWLRVSKTDTCWLWTGRVNGSGYGSVSNAVFAHRFSWELANGPIPKGLCVCHRCDRPSCVNPAHLFLATQGDNIRDCIRKGRHHSFFGKQKLNAEQVYAIRAAAASGERHSTIANRFGVSPANVSMIVTRKSWEHLPPTPLRS